MNNRFSFYYYKRVSVSACLQHFAGACSSPAPTTAPAQQTAGVETTSPAPAETQPPPTQTPGATPVPLAATVNGAGISLAEYQASLEQFKSAVGRDLEAGDETRVLDDLIDQALLAQAASENGYQEDPAALQTRISQLAGQMGGEKALETWMTSQGYTRQLFEQALALSLAAAWMRDRIIAEMPKTAEQVHARQILVTSADDAELIYTQLKAGNDFGNLALEADTLTGGDMGWFPRGYLPEAAKLDEAIFALEVEQYTPVIETLAGFHIIQVLEREAERSLDPDALLVLQTQAIGDWLAQQRSESSIEILIS